MSTVKPLAEVEPLHNPGHYHHGRPVVRVGGRHVLPLSCADDPGACRIAEAHINDAHAAVVEPLLAKLAQAREALAFTLSTRKLISPAAQWEADDRMRDALAAIDAANPGQWVPAERLKECQAVLADALEEKGDVFDAEAYDRAARARVVMRQAAELLVLLVERSTR